MELTVTINGASPITLTQTTVPPVNVSIVGATGPKGDTGPAGADGADGVGVPAGGTTGEALVKQSATDGDADWEYPHTLYVTVRNVSGGTLAKGTPVHANDVTGEVADVIAADASSASAMPCTYVLNEEIANNQQGIAILTGTITGVDTSSFSPGDVVYVAAGGGFTNVKPTGTNLIQNLGVVTKSNANTGSGVVYGTGRSNDVPNLPSGKFFIGSASNTAESAYTLPTADGSANQFLKTDGAGSVTFTSIVQATGNELENIVEDTTPQLGGTLDAQTNNITNLGSINGTAASTIISGAAAGATALQNVVEDTTPQLGGTLETQGNPINHSAGVALQYAGASKLLTQSTGIRTGGTVNVNGAYTLPTADGTTGQVLTTDGAGAVTFQTAGGGDEYIQFNGSANNGNTGQDRYIPLGGNYVDTSSIQIYSEAMCPFNGVVESITVRTDNASGSTVTKLWVNGTSVNSSTDTLSANTPLTIAFGDSVSTGDLIACSMNTTSVAGDSYVTVLIKKS